MVLVFSVIIGGDRIFQRDEAKALAIEAIEIAEVHVLVQNSMMR